MKRYALFGGENYYPSGGWGDFLATADSIDELRPISHSGKAWDSTDGGKYRDNAFRFGEKAIEWFQVIDLQTGEEVAKGSETQECLSPPTVEPAAETVFENPPQTGIPIHGPDGVDPDSWPGWCADYRDRGCRVNEPIPENAEETAQYEDIKIAALISVPMCGWNPHYGAVCEALRPFQIPLRLGYGAYWHQTMSNLLEDCIDDGLDWVLTLDYDSMFDAIDLDRLIRRFGQNPHIDALAAMQCKRGTDAVPLLTTGERVLEIARDNPEPIKVNTAHFGMTLFRLDALKQVPRPWFVGRPDENGSYRSLGRIDPDIAFWHGWTQAGKTIYVDPACSIGHLQPLVAIFDDEMKVQHVHVTDWRKQRKERRQKLGYE